eukprot:Gb_18347 [translate_table: standard]
MIIESSLLAIYELKVAKYKASTYLQYLTFLVFLPDLNFILEGLGPWVTNWWNTSQSQFFPYLQEENSLERFGEIEDLFLLGIMGEDYLETYSQDICIEIHKKIIRLVKIYNKDYIQIISHLLINMMYFSISSAYFIMDKKNNSILNS